MWNKDVLVVALANASSLEMVGDIFVDSVSSSPELYNNSIRDLVAVKIRPEAVITYKFHVNVTLTQNPSQDLNLSLRILAENHSVLIYNCLLMKLKKNLKIFLK